jgi:hypothetical protein
MPVSEDDVRRVDDMLYELRDIGFIEDYDRCPGVPNFDILTRDNKWIQIEVK